MVRGQLNEAQIALAYLLVVLGGSSRSGGRLGLLLAGLAFLGFDWFFLPPFGTLVVEKSVDWAVLAAFLLTSIVASQLLERARSEARDAYDRATELDHLASLGAETLNAGRAEDALTAIAWVIHSALGLDRCAIYVRDEEHGGARLMCRAPGVGESKPRSGFLEFVERVMNSGSALAIRANGIVDDISFAPGDFHNAWPADRDHTEAIVPLSIRERTVGVLTIGRNTGISLTPQQRRFLSALAYYAALGVERVRLVASAQSVDDLREASRLKDAVIASVSHDLRTPLTTIKALAAEIAAGGDERAMTIEEEADRLNVFVADLLDIARINSGTATLRPAPNEAEDLVGAALQRVQGGLDGRKVFVSLEPGEPLLFGKFDFAQTLRALVNLLENAVKYSPGPEPVELSVRREDRWLAFAVLDRGEGIPLSESEKIFEPFYRRPGSAPDAGGTGLGLSIARALVTAQGGSLLHSPRSGGGSVFTLRVPAIEVEDMKGT